MVIAAIGDFLVNYRAQPRNISATIPESPWSNTCGVVQITGDSVPIWLHEELEQCFSDLGFYMRFLGPGS